MVVPSLAFHSEKCEPPGPYAPSCQLGAAWSAWREGEGRNFAYGTGTCPVAEELHDASFLGINLCMYQFPSEDVSAVVDAFRKVWDNLDALK